MKRDCVGKVKGKERGRVVFLFFLAEIKPQTQSEKNKRELIHCLSSNAGIVTRRQISHESFRVFSVTKKDVTCVRL